MELLSLKAENYRNIERAEIVFESGVNLLIGDNAQGKTNALEAIYTFARGKSFRGAKDTELVRFGQDGYRIGITFHDRVREQSLSLRVQGKERVREKNGIRMEKQTEMLGIFRAVLFCPEHLQMVKGSPAERRQFLNVAISQCYPAYIGIYAEYQKLLDHRNTLLKFAQKGLYTDRAELEAFSLRLAAKAASIYRYRTDYVAKLCRYAPEIQSRLSCDRERLELTYDSGMDRDMPEKDAALAYEKVFTGYLSKEMAAGCTLYGVHRDELALCINGKSVREYGSQGQQRSVVLALKLAEGEACGDICGEYPVYLFDDVLSELDEFRRSVVITGDGKRQYIMTACDKNAYSGEAHCIGTKKGTYVSSCR